MTKEEARQEIQILTQKINYYNDLYYQKSISEITDYEFDQLMERLVYLEDKFLELKSDFSPTQRVGGTITKTFDTVNHRYPMLSLGNTYSRQELQEFDKRVTKGLNQPYTYFCELKFDGVALSLTYEQGILKRAVTRGDGVRGDDITNNARTIRSLPLQISRDNLPAIFEVRGEVFMPREVFNQINREREAAGEALLANPRNTASGTLKMQDSSIVARRKLDCFIYSMLGENLEFETHEQRIKSLEAWGFNVSPTYRKCKNIDQVFEYIDEWEMKRLELPLDTDGIVIKVNSITQQQMLGFTAKNPRWAIAYKYKAQDASTVLQSITYQVGRTGAITPVANLNPVLLAGTVVKRASLHNANEIERLDLRIGDTVFVEKGGEIIPKVTGVDLNKRVSGSKTIEYISHCPECGSALIRKDGEAVHFCPNSKGCPPQIKGRIEHFIHRKAMDINNLGHKTIDVLFDKGLVRSPADLYDLTYQDIIQLDRFEDLSTRNILNGIDASRKAPFENVLFALGIRYVGKTVAEKLATHFKSMDALKEATYEALIEVPEIGERIAQSVIDYFQDPGHIELVERLKKAGLQTETVPESQAKVEDNLLQDKTFVISGVFEQYEREELKEIIKKKGGKVLSSVSGKLDYLLAGEKMGPSKLEKARKLGTRIISEKEFQNMIDQ
ncbi:MAG: NAD-dependent DNA ligase LigA [Candidatus Cyclobacteriaceae bacterium M3_2C_046]